MTLTFPQRFAALAAERSPLCAGVDPSADILQSWGLTDDVAGLRAFCERLVEVCAPLVAAIKPQSAFFERHGPGGMAVLRDTVARARELGALAIIDGKRGDIASTAAAYGDALLGTHSPFGGDAITVSPYLGFGSLAPILEAARRTATGVFVVVRSSNPEGAAPQLARLPDGRTVAEHLADQIVEWNDADGAQGAGLIGAVVGATLGAEAGPLADRLRNALLLVPGIGAQGATIADVRRDFGRHYARTIPSISREIARAGPDIGAVRGCIERFIAEIRAA
jgi:orotidine-5'-phosphate decarboxylase